jgi:hypothetical protein
MELRSTTIQNPDFFRKGTKCLSWWAKTICLIEDRRIISSLQHQPPAPNDLTDLLNPAADQLQNIKIAFPLIIRHFNPMPKTIKTKRTPNAAFMKPVTPDAKLSEVVGAKPLPRTELTKKLWAYIRKNGLQDKKVRTQINADEALKAVFNGKKSVSMFEMTKLVSGHVKK